MGLATEGVASEPFEDLVGTQTGSEPFEVLVGTQTGPMICNPEHVATSNTSPMDASGYLIRIGRRGCHFFSHSRREDADLADHPNL